MRVAGIQRKFISRHNKALAARVRGRNIVDGHGDLRPEHIWLGDPVRIIDCLEFNPRLRAVDPFDEIAFLGLECERLGALWAGRLSGRPGNAGSAMVCASLGACRANSEQFRPAPRTYRCFRRRLSVR